MGMEAAPVATRPAIIVPKSTLPVEGTFTQATSGLYVPSQTPITSTRRLVVPSKDHIASLTAESVLEDAHRGYEELKAAQGPEVAELTYSQAWPVIDRVAADERHDKIIAEFMRNRVEVKDTPATS